VIRATHIIGLTAVEGGLLRSPDSSEAARAAVCAAVEARFRQIAAGGWLLARSVQPGRDGQRDLLHDPGRWFDFDELADDGRYVFLGTHSRYMDMHPAAVYPSRYFFRWASQRKNCWRTPFATRSSGRGPNGWRRTA